MPAQRPPRSTSKRDKNLPSIPSRTRPGLAVDTSFSRHRGGTPQLVKQSESNSITTELGAKQDESKDSRLQSTAYTPPTTGATLPLRGVHQSQTALPVHQRVKGLRPKPLNLGNEVSPSDRAITIGLSIPSAALSNHTQSPRSIGPDVESSPRRESQRYGHDLATPTIVITPAKEDFLEAPGRRPTSSLYSRHTNGLSSVPVPNQSTPPVPPLPKFATKSNATLRAAARDSAATKFEEDDSPPLTLQRTGALSVRTRFDDQKDEPMRSPPLALELTRKSSQHVATPRRSKGWWNVITSPFSAKSGAFSFWSSPGDEDEDGSSDPILNKASEMGRSDRSVSFADQQYVDNDAQSAPPTDPVRSSSLKSILRTPKRSDTAPGAIDSGSSADVNIYRIPGDGEAASYYDSKRNFSSMLGPKIGSRPRTLEDFGDFDPRKSCYQESRSVDDPAKGKENTPIEHPRAMRESEFYRIPEHGEAAEYYDSNRTFPSLVPYGWEYGNKGMGDWTPRRSVMPKDVFVGSGSLTKSPSDIGSAEADKSVPAGRPTVVERSPYQSGHAAEFEGFSGAYGPKERGFFSTPSEDEMNGRTPPGAKAAPYPLSPTSEATPIVEDAHTATYIGSQSSRGGPREVDVASTRTPTPGPPVPGNGLGNATMATREAPLVTTYSPPEAMSEKVPMVVTTQHSRNGSQGLGISEDEAKRGLFPRPAAMNEKTDDSSEYSEELPPRTRKSGCRWICFLVPFVIGGLIAAVVFLCVFFVPFPHVDEPVQAQWLNLTGYPPLPTGISTVIEPKPVQEVSGCVGQDQLWTCSVPACEDYMTTPGHTDQPNFRFEIRFRNNIVPSNETSRILSNSTIAKRSTGQAAQARELVKRTAWSSLLFSSSPSPPSIEDQTFLGRTTDNNSVPYAGEETPFYISLLDAGELASNFVPGLQKRDQTSTFRYPYPITSSAAAPSATATSSGSSESLTLTTMVAGPTNIPQPAIRTDRRPAPAVLYPFAYAQPLRLFNRGQSSEHYGFYTYFDRSMYLSVSSLMNRYTFGGDIDANVQLDKANAVCTWSQTRLLFQIWTQRTDVTSLFVTDPAGVPLMNSSANDMSAPGSFPYSITVKVDRHGGDASEKGVYCTSLNDDQQVTNTVRTWISENRGFDGTLVNPAAVPINNGTTLTTRSDNTEIDGGSGGCACQWQNWA